MWRRPAELAPEDAAMFCRLTVAMVMIGLLGLPHVARAAWARLTDAELMAQSEVIVMAELLGDIRVTLSPGQTPLRLGVLRVEETLKGDPHQTLLLLALPLPEGLRTSADIFYHQGQRGLWFLRARTPGEVGLYVADHPQRFLSAIHAAERIEAMRKILKPQADTP